MKAREIRELGNEEISSKIFELKTELAKQKAMSASGNRVEKPAKIGQLKKTLARVMTIQNERKRREIQKPKAVLSGKKAVKKDERRK